MSDFLNYFMRTSNIFHTPVKDMDPTKVFKVDDGYMLVCKTLGISPEDISIKVEDGDRMSYPTLRISGSTKIEAIDFENAVDLSITLNCKEDISGIDYNVKDGLTIIHLIVKERESKYNDMIKFNENLKV